MPATYSESEVVRAVVAYFNEPRFAEFFLETEVTIQIGANSGRADIVLRDGQGKFIAIAECKSSYGANYGKDQLKSYLSASDTQFGLLATSLNRDEWRYCERLGGNQFRQISQSAFEAGVLGESAPPRSGGGSRCTEHINRGCARIDRNCQTPIPSYLAISCWRFRSGLISCHCVVVVPSDQARFAARSNRRSCPDPRRRVPDGK